MRPAWALSCWCESDREEVIPVEASCNCEPIDDGRDAFAHVSLRLHDCVVGTSARTKTVTVLRKGPVDGIVVDVDLEKLLRSFLVGWTNYSRLADTPRVFAELDEWIRHRLRALHLKHWKRGRTIYRELRARGLSETGAAIVASNGRCWWKNSAKLINITFPIRYFDNLRLPRLAA